jgi:hypothetical protein
MALPITIPADYKGNVRISTSKGTQFNDYVTEYEEYFIKLLLGDEIYRDIKDAVTLPQKYIDLIDGLQYTNDNGKFVDYVGFKRVLLGLVYAKYNSDNFQTSIGGNVVSLNENSSLLTSGNMVVIAKRYNSSILEYRYGVWHFLNEYKDMSQVVTNRAGIGTVVIDVSSTKYINVGSIVTIVGNDYTVLSVVEDVSFTVDESTHTIRPLDSTDLVTYKPFYDICYKHVQYLSTI